MLRPEISTRTGSAISKALQYWETHRYWNNFGLMLGHVRRLWPNIKTPFFPCLLCIDDAIFSPHNLYLGIVSVMIVVSYISQHHPYLTYSRACLMWKSSAANFWCNLYIPVMVMVNQCCCQISRSLHVCDCGQHSHSIAAVSKLTLDHHFIRNRRDL